LFDSDSEEHRHGEESSASLDVQITRKLDGGQLQLEGSQRLGEVRRRLEIVESPWHGWLAQSGEMKASDAKRLREFEVEIALLKKLFSNQALDIDMPQEVGKGEF
jgi:hypothetical protein